MKFIKKNIYIITLIIVVILILAFIITKKILKEQEIELVENRKENSNHLIQDNISDKEVGCNIVKVDIKGEIVYPGVYELDDSKRVIDVINLAGGLTKKANTSLINLSKKINDEMVIIIYSNDEIANSMAEKIEIIETICKCDEIKNDSCLTVEDVLENEKEDEEITTSDKISLNNCTKDELLTISGIGDAKADAILKYKNEKGFTKIEDLLEVDGIGSKLYEQIKEFFKL